MEEELEGMFAECQQYNGTYTTVVQVCATFGPL